MKLSDSERETLEVSTALFGWSTGDEAIDATAKAVEGIIQARMAQAWDEGKAAEKRDWEFSFDLTTPDEDRQPWENPYR